jgi:hypothetical protein
VGFPEFTGHEFGEKRVAKGAHTVPGGLLMVVPGNGQIEVPLHALTDHARQQTGRHLTGLLFGLPMCYAIIDVRKGNYEATGFCIRPEERSVYHLSSFPLQVDIQFPPDAAGQT